MGVECPKCNFDNPDDTVYCGKCATPLSSSKEIPVAETLETPKEELTTGSTFAGRYYIIKELGKGGMGKVYRAIDKEINEEIVLKSIRRKLIQPELIGRFRAEFRVLTSLQHPNVATAYDFESLPGNEDSFFTTEFVEGHEVMVKECLQEQPRFVCPLAFWSQAMRLGLRKRHESRGSRTVLRGDELKVPDLLTLTDKNRCEKGLYS